MAALLQSAYQTVITHCPALWRWAYDWLGRRPLGSQLGTLTGVLQSRLRQLLAEHQPRALVSTYPFYSTLLAPLRNPGSAPPLFTVVTDSVSVHPSWTADPSDYYLVADQESAGVLQQRHIDSERVFVTGFPVHPAFAEPLPETLPQGRSGILYLPSTPARHVAATLEALRPLVLGGTHLTVAAGKHRARLHHILTRFTDSMPPDGICLLGWTSQMPHLLRSHELVICKAGGAILHEALAARTPAVIDYVVPGQEEGNAEMLLKHQCALRSHCPRETAAAASQMLAAHARVAGEMRALMIPPLCLPDAALAAAELIDRKLAIPPS